MKLDNSNYVLRVQKSLKGLEVTRFPKWDSDEFGIVKTTRVNEWPTILEFGTRSYDPREWILLINITKVVTRDYKKEPPFF